MGNGRWNRRGREEKRETGKEKRNNFTKTIFLGFLYLSLSTIFTPQGRNTEVIRLDFICFRNRKRKQLFRNLILAMGERH